MPAAIRLRQMPLGSRNRAPSLSLIGGSPLPADRLGSESRADARTEGRELDWSILMARAQNGERSAYRRLLEEVTPYLRALAVRRRVGHADVEDCVQDILLTVHAIRHTYDPTRPFGPWLVAIANHRITDGLRRRTRRRGRELPLSPEHETFAGPQANLGEPDANVRTLMEEIEKLPYGQRLALRLLKLEERSLKEAAGASGRSIGSLKVASHRALRTLQRVFARRDHET